MAKKRKELTVEQLENLTRGHGKKYVSLDEGAALYSIGKNTFRQMAKDAKVDMVIAVQLDELYDEPVFPSFPWKPKLIIESNPPVV